MLQENEQSHGSHVVMSHGSKSFKCMREKVIWSPIWAHLGTAPACRSEIEQ